METEGKSIVTFDTETASRSFSTNELRKKAFFLRIIGIPWLSQFFQKAAIWALELNLPIGILFKATIFPLFCGGTKLEDLAPVLYKLEKNKVGALLNFSLELQKKDADFDLCMNEIIRGIQMARNIKTIEAICIKITSLGDADLLEKRQKKIALTSKEEMAYSKLLKRLQTICERAYNSDIQLLFDAEESWIQDEIDRIIEILTLQYNKSKAMVFNTFQLYRTDRLDYLNKQIELAKEKKTILGAKLVRGAYMEKERQRALDHSYTSPIHGTKPATDSDFIKGMDACLANLDVVSFIAASQNQENFAYLASEIVRLSIPPSHPHISISQLYGMGDIITYNLAASGFRTTKYLPYGPVKDVIPYLIRRVSENSSVAGHMSRELEVVMTELQRRKKS